MTHLFLLKKPKRILINTNLFVRVKAVTLLLTKNEFLDIKKRIDVLDTTLKKYAFNMNKFSPCFQREKSKGNIHLIHLTHTMKNMHNMHIHINNISMLSCMAKWTHVHIMAAKAI